MRTTASACRGGRPAGQSEGSDRKRNPDPEEVEAPLAVAGIPHRLLLEAPVVDGRRRRPPRLGQRSVPRWRRRCAPAPGRQSYPMGRRGIDRASRCPPGSMVAASRGCRVRGSHRVRGPSPGPPGPRKSPGGGHRVRRVRGSHPGAAAGSAGSAEVTRVDRPARPVAVARQAPRCGGPPGPRCGGGPPGPPGPH